ncbi:four-carbon acid sugar kinase family protein [Kribbella sp. NPDC023972]|uniref:four-carbon acid sugar kinase family protein n=1 Tax=Kribbella sp. NPDC023972 TaxID=3154795 RepID=UPI0033F0571F
MLEAAFYGDDFTGSTDALLQFQRCGLRSVLLVDLPPAGELHDLASRYDVIGVAGIARSLGPDEQEAEIRPILTALRDLGPHVVQYKICSTADSSPHLGSIGRALEVGRSIFGPTVVPILAAQPELGRYTVFSHHFAAEAGTIHRLDRQPTMANHPATPMPESDLRRHLAHQTTLTMGALHLTSYADLPHSYYASASDHALILDALTDTDLRLLGQAIVASSNNRPLFAIGSGGLSRALTLNLSPTSPPKSPTPRRPPEQPTAAQTLVVSGSHSPHTRTQIHHAVTAGWTALSLHDPTPAQDQAIISLQAGTPGIIIHTDNPTAPSSGSADRELVGVLGQALAGIVREVVGRTGVRRVVIAGGDTSGRVVRSLGVSALELVPDADQLGPGTALCLVSSSDPAVDGLQVLLKGGQMGSPDLFERFRRQGLGQGT